ncbi:PREDICTED: patatin, partial [Prunus dulcis]
KIDGDHVRLVDYLDWVVGTSTGGLMASMLTTPNKNNRPLYAAKDIVSFYRQHCPKIFPQPSSSRIGKIIHYLKCLVRPKYNGKYLRKLLKKILGDKHLHDMLTNVAITTTDIKQGRAVIFSSHMLKKDPSLDALMSDICVGTSAAPAYLPPHQFTTTTSTGESREFNLIDGGIAANNPAMVGITESETDMHEGNTGIHERILLISLGTGTTSEKKYDAKKAACWGALDWLIGKDRSAPLVDLLMRVNSVMVEYESGSFFKTLRSNGNYLRIQDDTLSGTLASVDIATEENLNDLVKVGEALLKKPVSRLNLDTGKLEPVHPEVTNEVALERMAKILSEERARRKRRVVVHENAALFLRLNYCICKEERTYDVDGWLAAWKVSGFMSMERMLFQKTLNNRNLPTFYINPD